MSRKPEERDEPKLQILCVMPAPTGYRGICRKEDRFVYFRFSKREGFKEIVDYPASDFLSMAHFTETISKFVPTVFFLDEPVDICLPTMESFEEIYRGTTAGRKKF